MSGILEKIVCLYEGEDVDDEDRVNEGVLLYMYDFTTSSSLLDPTFNSIT